MGLQAVRNGPPGPFLTGDHSAWNTGFALSILGINDNTVTMLGMYDR